LRQEVEALKRALASQQQATRDMGHVNDVMVKAISDLCDGKVTLEQMRGWWLRGENEKVA